MDKIGKAHSAALNRPPAALNADPNDSGARSALDPAPVADTASRRRRLPPLLRKAWFGLNQTFRRFSAKVGITPDQFTVLRTLVEIEPWSPTQCELSRKITSDPNTITSLLRRMEAGGLIRRHEAAEDRRARRIVINPLGRKVYEQAAPLALELQNRVLLALPEHRREAFLEDLETIANSCQNAMKQWR